MTEVSASLRAPKAPEKNAVMSIFQMAHEDTGLFPFNESKVADLVDRGIAKRDVIMGVIEGPGGVDGIEGVAALALEKPWYSDQFQLLDRLIFVHPACRRSNHAKRLLNFVKWSSDSMSEIAGYAVPVFPSILTRNHLFEKMRLFQRTFPQQIGATFAYNLDVGATFAQRRPGDIKAA